MIEPVTVIQYVRHCISSLSPAGRNSEFNTVLRDRFPYQGYHVVEEIRNRLIHDHTPVIRSLHGAGSHKKDAQTVAGINRISSVTARYGRLLFRIAGYYKPDRIIEFGTALGISTMYLATGYPSAELISIEGNPSLTAMARINCQAAGLKNTTIMNRTFNEALPVILPICTNQTLVFIDGNHTLEATLEFYGHFSKNAIGIPMMVFDDIHWSDGMYKAWRTIKSEWPELVVELTRMGILLKCASGPKQILKFNY